MVRCPECPGDLICLMICNRFACDRRYSGSVESASRDTFSQSILAGEQHVQQVRRTMLYPDTAEFFTVKNSGESWYVSSYCTLSMCLPSIVYIHSLPQNPAFGPPQVRDLTEIFLRKSAEVWDHASKNGW